MKHRSFAAALLVPGSLAFAQGAVIPDAIPAVMAVEVSPAPAVLPDPVAGAQAASEAPSQALEVPEIGSHDGMVPVVGNVPEGGSDALHEHAPLGLKDAVLTTWDVSPQEGDGPEPFRLSDAERQAIRDMLRKAQASLTPDSEGR
ncbi:hypothetical protein [Hydrogenophaga sp. 5NK40-0174]|uniref:hypothetical protein n=1 Tax=Hydrogenophaga sp. 5NK40-0174 TaxID=3127649 RepID=UPI003341ABF1